jgi:hypothetical protein
MKPKGSELDFRLQKTPYYYSPHYFINTKGRNDLVITPTRMLKVTWKMIIEGKSPTNKPR